MNTRMGSLLAATALVLTGTVLHAPAKDIAAQVPDPDGKAGDAIRPVKVYILAGQSNMVGMGNLSGAKCRYTGIGLTADPPAPAIHQRESALTTVSCGTVGCRRTTTLRRQRGTGPWPTI